MKIGIKLYLAVYFYLHLVPVMFVRYKHFLDKVFLHFQKKNVARLLLDSSHVLALPCTTKDEPQFNNKLHCTLLCVKNSDHIHKFTMCSPIRVSVRLENN